MFLFSEYIKLNVLLYIKSIKFHTSDFACSILGRSMQWWLFASIQFWCFSFVFFNYRFYIVEVLQHDMLQQRWLKEKYIPIRVGLQTIWQYYSKSIMITFDANLPHFSTRPSNSCSSTSLFQSWTTILNAKCFL